MAKSRDFKALQHSQSGPSHLTQMDLEAQPIPSQVNGHSATFHGSPPGSIRHRRPTRSSTAKTYRPERRGQPWQPGQEPGIDTSANQQCSEWSIKPELYEECEIMVVDFSQEQMCKHHLGNTSLAAFLAKAQPDWAVCRWINVNGLSWDVIKLLGNHKGLHRLAIEDLMNPKNRTKADWYSDHTYSGVYVSFVPLRICSCSS